MNVFRYVLVFQLFKCLLFLSSIFIWFHVHFEYYILKYVFSFQLIIF